MSNFIINSYALAPAGFDPKSVTGLKGWWDAADASTITHVSDAVSQWDDKSGEGNHVSQSTESDKPLTGQVTINGLNTISFDGTDDFLRRATFVGGAETQPNTIFWVGIPDLVTAGARLWDGATLNNRNTVFDNVDDYVLFSGAILNTNVLITGDAQQITAIFDSTSSQVRKNGSQIGSTGNGGTDPQNGMTFGATHDGTAVYANMEVAECLIYEGVISGSDLTDIETYLSDKWGL